MKSLTTLLFITGLTSFNTHAVEKHVHGEAQLFIAIEETTVLIDFESPADNIIGFEHAPRTDEQKALVENSEQQLQLFTNLLEFGKESCTQTNASINVPFEEHHDVLSEDHHDKDHDEDHHNEHSEDHHDEDGHDDHHDSHDDDTHTEFQASYTLECSADAIKTVNIKVLNTFPRIKTLEANWVSGQKQGSQKVTKKNTAIRF